MDANDLNPADEHDTAAPSIERVQCPNCCKQARVTARRMGLLFYRCDLCETVGAAPDPAQNA